MSKYRLVLFTALLLGSILVFSSTRIFADQDKFSPATALVQLTPAQLAKIEPADIAISTSIDYGQTYWVGFDAQNWPKVAALSLQLENQPVSYELNLGNRLFDPLQEANRGSLANAKLDLQLVQFHGPTKQAWLDQIEEAGAEVVQYIHPFTYVIWADGAALSQLASQTQVRWTGEFKLDYRTQIVPVGRSAETTRYDILMVNQGDPETILNKLVELGATNVDSANLNKTWSIATLDLSQTQVDQAAAIAGVYSIQPDTEPALAGEYSNQIITQSFDSVTQLPVPGYQAWLAATGLDGSGVLIANVDTGIWTPHPELSSRILTCTGTTCAGAEDGDHGTHTAGIMAGDGSTNAVDGDGFLRGQGVAPGANLIEQFWANVQNSGGMLELMKDSYDNGAELSGNSWVSAYSPQGYDNNTMQVDIGVRDTDSTTAGDQYLTYVQSIWNGGGGTSTQGAPDEAKNSFRVGATRAQDYWNGPQVIYDILSFTTAHGPALDGRRLPDIVAPGCDVESTVPDNINPPEVHGMRGWCGTSMASPHVSGAVALFIEKYRNEFSVDPSPALIKAYIMAGTDDLVGNFDADNNTLGHRPDSKQGWGRLNLNHVVNPGAVLYYDQAEIFDNTGDMWEATFDPVDPNKPMTIMLAYTDAPGHGMGGNTPAWNNNLDLVGMTADGTHYGNVVGTDGWATTGGSADSMNNVEGLLFGPTAPNQVTIQVKATNISSNGLPNSGDNTDQDFALVCVNCQVGVPAAVTLQSGSAETTPIQPLLIITLAFVAILSMSVLVLQKRQ